VPSSAIAPLFANATELAQGQAITDGAEKATFADLGSYEFAGSFAYPGLAGLTLGTGSAACAPLGLPGIYNHLNGADLNPVTDGVTVYLNQSLRVSDALPGDYAADTSSYAWSIGNRTGNCVSNGTPPASVVGTWQTTQYGPLYQNAAGSYSIWIR